MLLKISILSLCLLPKLLNNHDDSWSTLTQPSFQSSRLGTLEVFGLPNQGILSNFLFVTIPWRGDSFRGPFRFSFSCGEQTFKGKPWGFYSRIIMNHCRLSWYTAEGYSSILNTTPWSWSRESPKNNKFPASRLTNDIASHKKPHFDDLRLDATTVSI